ncbi:MAG: AMP-dependent synthetase and ligase, partial [Ilumatobacteraceae bacterium]|nr:AMP-dependent synthetase and ligase [Ilumatobacteraceae bacterium]
ATELIEHARAQLAKYNCPRTVEFRSTLPRTETGKLYKRLLREEHRASAPQAEAT